MKKIKIKPLSKEHLDEIFDENQTFGERIADHVAEFVGSWKFIILFTFFLIGWMSLNALAVFAGIPFLSFDKPPFILLNLILSCIAAFQAPLIMMSQNRQGDRDRSRDELQFDITNEMRTEIYVLNEKINILLADKEEAVKELEKAGKEAIAEQNNMMNKYKEDE